jgi:hypothetical protein
LVFHFTGDAPVWSARGRTGLILIGLNVEICFMFDMAGITFSKMLPPDRKLEAPGRPSACSLPWPARSSVNITPCG